MSNPKLLKITWILFILWFISVLYYYQDATNHPENYRPRCYMKEFGTGQTKEINCSLMLQMQATANNARPKYGPLNVSLMASSLDHIQENRTSPIA
jgi:hypothetical protein